jgi:hypothetical protein
MIISGARRQPFATVEQQEWSVKNFAHTSAPSNLQHNRHIYTLTIVSIASSLSAMSAAAAPWMTELPIIPMANIPLVTPKTTMTLTATTTLTVLVSPVPQISTSAPQALLAYTEVQTAEVPVHTTTTTMATSTISISSTPRVVHTEVQGDCAPQPTAYGPVPNEDNMWGFYDSSSIHDAAANAPTPPHYTQSFAFANASYVGGTYLGHYELESYDTLNCSARCDEYTTRILSDMQSNNKTSDEEVPSICQGINIYFERSPVIYLGPKCPNSKSRTVIKCALWGDELEAKNATNTGYTEWNFDVVIAGSNGYSLGEEGKASAGVRSAAGNNGKGRLMMVLGFAAVMAGVFP